MSKSNKDSEKDIDDCAKPWDRQIPGVGTVARFDAQSGNAFCKRLAVEGSDYVKTELVRRFCNSFPKDKIPERCKCYRFKDTPDFAKYRSIWEELVSATGSEGEGSRQSQPFIKSYTCFYEKCATDAEAYQTPQMLATKCPDTVFCKQQIGSINVKGDSLAEVEAKLIQKCGAGKRPEPEPEPEKPESGDGLSQEAIIALVGVGILVLLVVVMTVLASR
jgi:hypothetical protein